MEGGVLDQFMDGSKNPKRRELLWSKRDVTREDGSTVGGEGRAKAGDVAEVKVG